MRTKIKRITLVGLLFAVSSLMAGSGPGQSTGANKLHSKHPKEEVTVQGCLSTAAGDYTLVQTDPGNSYDLESRKVNLGMHLGEQVEITGRIRISLDSSSDIFYRKTAGSETIMVESLRTIAKECTAREFIDHLSMTFDPAFPTLKATTCATASFTFPGAADGDTLALGVPNARTTGGGTIVYFAWVSAANTVTLQGCNISGAPQKTAGSGAIRVDLWKH